MSERIERTADRSPATRPVRWLFGENALAAQQRALKVPTAPVALAEESRRFAVGPRIAGEKVDGVAPSGLCLRRAVGLLEGEGERNPGPGIFGIRLDGEPQMLDSARQVTGLALVLGRIHRDLRKDPQTKQPAVRDLPFDVARVRKLGVGARPDELAD